MLMGWSKLRVFAIFSASLRWSECPKDITLSNRNTPLQMIWGMLHSRMDPFQWISLLFTNVTLATKCHPPVHKIMSPTPSMNVTHPVHSQPRSNTSDICEWGGWNMCHVNKSNRWMAERVIYWETGWLSDWLSDWVNDQLTANTLTA